MFGSVNLTFKCVLPNTVSGIQCKIVKVNIFTILTVDVWIIPLYNIQCEIWMFPLSM